MIGFDWRLCKLSRRSFNSRGILTHAAAWLAEQERGKRNFDDNNSFIVLLPLLFPPFLFQRAARTPGIEEHGSTEVLMALVTLCNSPTPHRKAGSRAHSLICSNRWHIGVISRFSVLTFSSFLSLYWQHCPSRKKNESDHVFEAPCYV